MSYYIFSAHYAFSLCPHGRLVESPAESSVGVNILCHDDHRLGVLEYIRGWVSLMGEHFPLGVERESELYGLS